MVALALTVELTVTDLDAVLLAVTDEDKVPDNVNDTLAVLLTLEDIVDDTVIVAVLVAVPDADVDNVLDTVAEIVPETLRV